eukprot:gene544-1199_t
MYPFSTQNHTDFANLMSVYLDAAFFPNLNELDFLQEGWRLENETINDPNSPLVFKGVVFNEMKGALSNPEALFATHYQNLMLPSHTYGTVSGGDPLVIPELTWKQLKDFHRTHYHPTNSKFYTYGDQPLENHLELINKQALQHFDRISTNTEIPDEPKWTKPRQAEMSCPPDTLAADASKQTTITVGYMLESTDDPFDVFTMGILSSLLASGPNSPFYQALIKPNIGSGYAPVVGVDGSTRNPTFAIGLQGVSQDDVPNILNIIQETFEKAAREGFEQERIESILHRVELSQKHQTSNFGLGLISTLMSSWNHDADPVSMMKVNEQVKKFRNELEEDPEFLQKKVKEYFLSNLHQLTLEMNPKEDYLKMNDEREAQILNNKIQQLTEEDRKIIMKKALQLEKKQHETEDLSCLPKMFVKDANVPVQFCEQPTNGVTYFRAIADASSLPFSLKPYLPLFCSIITKMGAGNRNYEELSQDIEMYTGGLSVSPHLVSHHTDQDNFELGVMFSSHCLERNHARMFSLWQDVFNQPNLKDYDRLRTLINSIASDLAMSIADSGHMYSMTSSASSLTPAARFGELFGGMSQVLFMKEIAESDDLESVANNLIQIAYYLLNVNDVRCSLNIRNGEARVNATAALDEFLLSLDSLGSDEIESYTMPSFKAKNKSIFMPMPFPVNYVSQSIRTAPYCHEDHPRLRILAKLISAKYLHREIREKGGAYGGGAKIGSSVFSFFSYRDPNDVDTLKAFEGSVKWASNREFTSEDVEEAKLSVFAAIDSPISPANRGFGLFSQGITDDMKQMYRDRLFQCSEDDLVDVSNRYLLPGVQVDSRTIIGPENEQLEKSDKWQIKKGM